MATLDALIETLCPKLAVSPVMDIYKELAGDRTSVEYLGKHYNYGMALVASHLFTIDNSRPNGDSGMITSKTEGRTSISYWNAVNIKSNSDLHMTSYGKRYLSLIHMVSPAILPGSGYTGEFTDVI